MRVSTRIIVLLSAIAASALVAPSAYAADPIKLDSLMLPAATTGTSVMVSPSTTGGDGCEGVRYAGEDAVFRTDFQPCKASMYPLPATPGVVAILAQVRGYDGSISPVANFHITRVVTPAPVAPIKLTSILLPGTTTSNIVTTNPVTNNGSDGCAAVRYANEDGKWDNWAMCKASPHHLTAGYGYRGVYAQVKGYNGAVSNVLYTRITVVRPAAPVVNTPVPVINSVILPGTSSTQTIIVKITATDDKAVAMMRLANEDGVWMPWRAYSATAIHSLSSTVGYKGVYVQVKDAQHRTSNIIYSRTRLTSSASA